MNNTVEYRAGLFAVWEGIKFLVILGVGKQVYEWGGHNVAMIVFFVVFSTIGFWREHSRPPARRNTHDEES